MTGIVDKIVRNVIGSVHDIVDNTSDAGTEARQIVRELDDQITKTESSFIDVKATYTLQQNALKAAQDESEKWKSNAQKALDKGDEALARQCLERKAVFVEKANTLKATVDSLKPQVDTLEAQLNALKAKLFQMDSKSDLIEARSDVAKAQQKAATIIDGIGNSNLTSDFDALENKVKKSEARARVMSEQANAKSSLENAVNSLDTAVSIDDELASMKKSK
jgi:phage shock protein A